MDKQSCATTARPGLAAALAHVRDGDVLVAHTRDLDTAAGVLRWQEYRPLE
ncbi:MULTISPECIES: hypothetical protein [Micrococcaceae]|uniref:hypothetical protein n=1 Tax=Micrococcaceae TaxID=1268 RepID=UPI0015E2ED6F|nr:hypothetical protein [Arthrobacter sp. N199823]